MNSDPRFKPLPVEAASLVSAGKTIDAIKWLRSTRGLDLKAAKDWVDWHIGQNPLLREQFAEQQREMRKRLFAWLLPIDALIIAGVIYWFFYRGTP